MNRNWLISIELVIRANKKNKPKDKAKLSWLISNHVIIWYLTGGKEEDSSQAITFFSGKSLKTMTNISDISPLWLRNHGGRKCLTIRLQVMVNIKWLPKQFRLVRELASQSIINELIIAMSSKMKTVIKEARPTEKYQSYYQNKKNERKASLWCIL